MSSAPRRRTFLLRASVSSTIKWECQGPPQRLSVRNKNNKRHMLEDNSTSGTEESALPLTPRTCHSGKPSGIQWEAPRRARSCKHNTSEHRPDFPEAPRTRRPHSSGQEFQDRTETESWRLCPEPPLRCQAWPMLLISSRGFSRMGKGVKEMRSCPLGPEGDPLGAPPGLQRPGFHT